MVVLKLLKVCGVEENILLGVGDVFCGGKDGGGTEKSCLLLEAWCCRLDPRGTGGLFATAVKLTRLRS